MKLRTKLTIVINAILIISILVVATVSIYQFRKAFKQNISEYRKEAVETTLSQLKDIVNIAYSMIDNSYQLSSPDAIRRRLKLEIKDTNFQSVMFISVNMMKITLSNLRILRFGVDGYLWINEFENPYKVIMHGSKPDMEGKSHVFYIEGTNNNVYDAFHDSIVAGSGSGRVTYDWYKPGTNEKIPKISWVRLYEPLGWVIGTGVYIDHIDKMVRVKEVAFNRQIQAMLVVIIFITAIFVILSTIILTLFTRTITNPIQKIQEQLNVIAQGQVVEQLKIKRKDEIGDIALSLNKLISGLQRYADFSKEIGKENYQAHFQKLSDKDVLGTALINMRDSLSLAKIKEQERQQEDRTRQWITEGINRIGDIITISKTIEELTENVIIRLIDHTKAAAGAIFILDYDDVKKPFLSLSASVAYNRKKHLKKTIEFGEGLVGACYLEQKPINMTDTPEEYLIISTGIGESKPRNIYITPLKFENNIYGVMEIAAFKVFESHTLTFIEEVAKLLAVSLSTKEKYIEI